MGKRKQQNSDQLHRLSNQLSWLSDQLHYLMDTREQPEKGATMIEYVMLAAVIAVVCIAGVTFLGTEASSMFSDAGEGFCNGPVC